jgi:hypothetical protein
VALTHTPTLAQPGLPAEAAVPMSHLLGLSLRDCNIFHFRLIVLSFLNSVFYFMKIESKHNINTLDLTAVAVCA